MLPSEIPDELIKHRSDFQIAWEEVLPHLTKGRFQIEAPDVLSIQGDAPKSFIRIREHGGRGLTGKNSRRQRVSKRPSRWPAYIAKVGSKWYPIESVTEQVMTRIGQLLGVRIAHSHLRIVGNQVRFLSRYFLKTGESLFHGIDLFKLYLRDDELVDQIAKARDEQSFYTFQTVLRAIEDYFPDHVDDIMRGMVEMLTFDSLVGNNDRHPANWGVIAAATGLERPRFSPVFDTARALFWNVSERRVRDTLADEDQLAGYINRSRPQIGWDHCSRIGHFELISRIVHSYPAFRPSVVRLVLLDAGNEISAMVENEFGRLMSSDRRRLIIRCLQRRRALLIRALGLAQ